MKIENFYDKQTGTFSYIIICEDTKKVAIIDPIANFNFSSSNISYELADEQIKFIQSNNLQVEWILETHIHADHLTSANYLKERLGGKIAINNNYNKIKDYWADFFQISLEKNAFNHFLKDQEEIQIGNLNAKIIHTPGHTPTCLCFIIENNIFVGDLLLMPEIGCARCDFIDGDAKTLYDSIQKIYSLDENINIFTCHDYPKVAGKQKNQTTIKDHLENNVMLNKNTSKEEFIKRREEKDATMPVPKLILPSIQANINAGKIEDFIKLPINKL